MKQFNSRIIRNEQISVDFFEMLFTWGDSAGVPKPGQFLTFRVSQSNVPLLRRPFAFAGYDGSAGCASIIYQKRGRGTEILSAMQPKELIDVIGPLGNAFPVAGNQGESVAAAGGVGLGPILFLADNLNKRGIDTKFIFGCRSASLIPTAESFKNASPQICTDDGSAGFAGNVVQYINANIHTDTNTIIYGCGPVPMLKGLHTLSQSAKSQYWASLEEMMACGVGACMGCAIPTASGYQCACKNGPVFNGGDIAWEQM